jgi:hypothetical protein
MMKRIVIVFLLVNLILSACKPVPTPTHTPSPTQLPTTTPTSTPTAIPTATPTNTPRPSVLTSSPTNLVQSMSKNMATLFRLAQEKARKDPTLQFVIEHYGPGCEGICVLSIRGGAKGIVDVGEDYVCIDDVLFDDKPPSKDVCIPYSSIVRIQFTNTMFP